jgi:hypothetical protein
MDDDLGQKVTIKRAARKHRDVCRVLGYTVHQTFRIFRKRIPQRGTRLRVEKDYIRPFYSPCYHLCAVLQGDKSTTATTTPTLRQRHGKPPDAIPGSTAGYDDVLQS